MVFGGVAEDRIQFNESTLWIGEPCDYAHEGAAKFLPEIRRLLFEGKQKEAEQLALRVFMSEPLRQRPYQPFADLRFQFPGHDRACDYRRDLNLDQAVARTSYKVGGVRYEREVFASAPDQVIVMHIAADKPGQVAFSVRFDCPHAKSSIKAWSQNEIALSGAMIDTYEERFIGRPLKFESRLQVRVRCLVVFV
jgi:alpha-L-fucosidase 2